MSTLLEIIFRLFVAVCTIALSWQLAHNIDNTWHDTRMICQQVTHTQSVKICR